MEKKNLSLDHLEQAIKLLSNDEDPYKLTKLVAVYLADNITLYKSRTNTDVMEPLIIRAAEMSAEDAAEVISFFTEACLKFSQVTNRATEKSLEPHPAPDKVKKTR